MIKAVIYARTACMKQSVQGIRRQVETCNKYAEENGIEVVRTYIDAGASGRDENRVAYKQLLLDSKSDDWDVVLVEDGERLSRNNTKLHKYRRKLAMNCKVIVFVSEEIMENELEECFLNDYTGRYL